MKRFSLRTLFWIVVCVAVSTVPFAVWRQRQLIDGRLRHAKELLEQTREKKAIENEYFIKQLLAQNPEIIGSSRKRLPDIQLTADCIFRSERAALALASPYNLELLTPTSRDLAAFSEMFDEVDGGLEAKISVDDTVYWYRPRRMHAGIRKEWTDLGSGAASQTSQVALITWDSETGGV